MPVPTSQGGAAAARRFHGPEVARSSRAPDPSISFTLGGTPPNWLQGAWHGHWAKNWRAKQGWLDRVVLTGGQARINARLPLCPKERRIVEIRCYRLRLMDFDGAAASIKPILDGLAVELRRKMLDRWVMVPGAGLIYDDSPEWVELVSPGNLQVKVSHRAEVRTEVTVRLP